MKPFHSLPGIMGKGGENMKKRWLDVLFGVLMMAMLTGCQSPGSAAKDKASEREGVTGEEKEEQEEEKQESVLEQAEIFADEEEKTDEESDIETDKAERVVVGGFKILIPGEYGCFIDDTKGLIIYRDDLFTMQYVVKEGSYAEKMENPGQLMEGVENIGGDIQKDIREIEIDGKPYAYFTYTFNEDDFIIIYTNALDSDKRFCAQVLLVSEQLEEKEVLKRFAQIVSSAKETEEPDTTQESLDEQRTLADLGEQKEESRLQCADRAVTYQIEEGFYSDYVEESAYFSSEYFLEYPHDRAVDCYLIESEEENAQQYIERETEWLDEGALVKEEQTQVNGHTFYYLLAEYDYEGSHFRCLKAAADVGEGYVYKVSVSSIDGAKELKIADFKKFLTFEEE